jgi:hypothetical protein
MSNHYFSQPGQVDAFTRVMAEMFQKRNTVQSNMAMLSFFGNPDAGGKTLFTNDATNVSIEIVKSNNKIAKFGTRGIPTKLGPSNIQKQGFLSAIEDRQFPIIKDDGGITATDTFVRMPGETIYTGSKSRFDRVREQAGNIFYNSIVDTIWLHEALATQSILEGKMAVNNTGGEFDFGRNPDNTVNFANPWTDQGSGTPIADIDTLCTRAQRNGLVKVDFVGMDVKSFDAFQNHDTVTGTADNRRIDVVWIGKNTETKPPKKYKRHVDAGWDPRAFLVTPSGKEVWLFTHDNWYTNDAGEVVEYMPLGTVFATGAKARFDRYFGPDDKLPAQFAKHSVIESLFGIGESVMVDAIGAGASSIIDPRMLKFFAYGNGDNSAITLQTQSAPIYACTNVDAVAVGKNAVL